MTAPDDTAASRLLRKALWRLQQPINARYRDRHPGALANAVLRAAAPLVGQMVPMDKWSLAVHAPAWMAAVHAPPLAPLPPPRRIFMYAAYNGQFSQELALAALLAWRGHTVTLGYLPKLRSPVKRPFEDHPSASPYLADALRGVAAASGGRVRVFDMTAFADPAAPVDEEFVARQSKLDVVMGTGRERFDMDDADDRALLDYFAARCREAQRTVWSFLAPRRGEFDFALVPNGSTFESAVVCQICRLLGLTFTTTEKFSFRDVRAINHGDDFRAFRDLDHIWVDREALGYVGAYRAFAAAQAMALMDARRKSSTAQWMWALQKAPGQTAADALRDAGADPARPYALVCTNVPYDAGHDKLTRFFPTMRQWLVDSVRTLVEVPDLQVIVRCHPAEAAYYGSTERSEDNLAAEGLRPGGRLSIIPGERSTNTYGLMELCKFGAVFSSTTGLEMAMMGRKVAVGADIYYRGRGFTVDGDSAEAYLRNLDALARAPGRPELTAEQATDAQLMYFLLHYPMQWPFPWNKAGAPIRDLPPQRLVRMPEVRTYLQTLDAMGTPPEEFHARFGDFLGADTCRHLPRPAAAPAAAALSEAL